MKYDPQKYHRPFDLAQGRHSIRLKGYDYTQPGAYFVTFCTYQRDEILGEVLHGEMKLSALGMIVQEEWFRSAQIRKEIQLFDDEFIVMPNHGHGIIRIIEIVGADGVRPGDGVRPINQDARGENQDARGASLRRAARSLGSVMAGFKASVTSRAKQELNIAGIWQRNYYDHIIRNDRELENIQWYIYNNPLNWQQDRDNLQNVRKLSPPERTEEYTKDVEEMVLKLKANTE
ncbi:MAG: hypothetical protein WBL25_13240 [Anaerolineales bacterium]